MAGRAEVFIHPMFRGLEEADFWIHKNPDGKFTSGGPDYFLAMSGTQVEVKNSERTGELADEPSEKQVRLLDRYGGFIFLVMYDSEGSQRMPNGADAYLVPWPVYKEWWARMKELKGKSVRRHATARAIGADDELGQYRLEWANGRWNVPVNHPSGFWSLLRQKAHALNLFIEQQFHASFTA